MIKKSGLTNSQWAFLGGGSAVVLLLSIAAYQLFGAVALIVPMVLGVLLVGFLVLEARQFLQAQFYQLRVEGGKEYAQLDALMSIHRMLGPGMPLPPGRGWAASPDLLREVMRLILREKPAVAVEVSSGTSTLIMAYMLERIGEGHVFALEHDEHYANRTREYLREHGLDHRATVIHAPLVEHPLGGATVRWYDLAALELPGPIAFLLVDGPPDTIGPMARYPAVPLLKDRFSANTTVLLDDGARADEASTAERWSDIEGAISKEYLDLEKGAWLLRYRSAASSTGEAKS